MNSEEVVIQNFLEKNHNYSSDSDKDNGVYRKILKRFKKLEIPSELPDLKDLNIYLENLVAILNLVERIDAKKANIILKNIIKEEKKYPIEFIDEIREKLKESGGHMLDAAVRNYIRINYRKRGGEL